MRPTFNFRTHTHPWHFVCAVIVFLCFSSSCFGEPTTIRIRFANGKNGKPLRLKFYEQGSGAVGAGNYKVDRVDRDSLIVTFNDVSTFAFRSAAFDPCDVQGKHTPQPKYDLQEVVAHGVVSPNHCGRANALPKPGELLIYSRHEHWWEVTRDVARGLLICA